MRGLDALAAPVAPPFTPSLSLVEKDIVVCSLSSAFV